MHLQEESISLSSLSYKILTAHQREALSQLMFRLGLMLSYSQVTESKSASNRRTISFQRLIMEGSLKFKRMIWSLRVVCLIKQPHNLRETRSTIHSESSQLTSRSLSRKSLKPSMSWIFWDQTSILRTSLMSSWPEIKWWCSARTRGTWSRSSINRRTSRISSWSHKLLIKPRIT